MEKYFIMYYDNEMFFINQINQKIFEPEVE